VGYLQSRASEDKDEIFLHIAAKNGTFGHFCRTFDVSFDIHNRHVGYTL
jgi:hypothetical protein